MFRPALKMLKALHFCQQVTLSGRPHKVENLQQLVAVVVEVRWLETQHRTCIRREAQREKHLAARKELRQVSMRTGLRENLGAVADILDPSHERAAACQQF